MSRFVRIALALLAAIWGGLVLAGCSGQPATGGGDSPTLAADTVIVDVRTPEEFATGHLEGAVNIDLNSGRFEEEISALATDVPYVIYCRSGNRSAQAIRIMKNAGFTNLTNGGSVQEASEMTGLPIVTG